MTRKKLLSQHQFEVRDHELAAAIVRAGLEQQEFAKLIGFSGSHVSLVLNRKRKATPRFIKQTLAVLSGYQREDLFICPSVSNG